MFKADCIIPKYVESKVANALGLALHEEYLGIRKYVNEFTDMNVVYTDNEIVEICVRSTLDSNNFVHNLLKDLQQDDVDIFIPSKF